MKYLRMVYGEEHGLERPMPSERAVGRECRHEGPLRSSGPLLAVEALPPIVAAMTMRARDSRVSITDGPFAETKG